MSDDIDWKEVLKRVFKYTIQVLIVALAARYIPAHELKIREIIMISIIAALTYAVLDLYSPSVSTRD